jgi:hypothetical protein
MSMGNHGYKTIDFQADFTLFLMIADGQKLLLHECSYKRHIYYL